MLSPAQLQSRDGKLTASRVACLMTGDADKIMALWREMIGDPSFEPEDLSAVWPVQLGSATENINLDWFERKFGPVSRRGEVVTGAVDWMAATLDGFSDLHSCPVECKHVGGREAIETIIDRYQPQMQWQMLVTRTKQCALSVIEGAGEPVVEFLPFDAAYTNELSRRAHAFMDCVRSLTPPVALVPAEPPVIPTHAYDMAGNNQWASEAVTWLTTKQAKKDNEAAEKVLKGLVPADAVRCHGHSIEIKRDKAGRLSLREKSV